MNMVSHQAPSQYANAGIFYLSLGEPQINPSIMIRIKDFLLVNTALGNVVRQLRQHASRISRHICIVAFRR